MYKIDRRGGGVKKLLENYIGAFTKRWLLFHVGLDFIG